MKDKEHTTKSDKETQGLAKELAREVSNIKGEESIVIALEGDLGAGKTTFVQAFAEALGVKERVLSPTFLIMKRFDLPEETPFNSLYHIDAYRIESQDLIELGFNEAVENKNILVVEWADKVKDILPSNTLWIRFKHGEQPTQRHITLNRR